jgi:hypothetical protein
MFRRKRAQSRLTAVPMEQIDVWVSQVLDAASAAACSGTTPAHIDVLGRVALLDVCGRERGATMPESAGNLAYNLFLLGYWSRDEELRILGQTDDDPYLEGWMEGIREHDDITWFAAIQKAAHMVLDHEDIRYELAEHIAPGAGDDFRHRLAMLGTAGMVDAIEGEDPGASQTMTEAECVRCFVLAYWTHFACNALGPDAQDALAAECA